MTAGKRGTPNATAGGSWPPCAKRRTVVGVAVKHSGWPTTGELLVSLSFPGSLTLSMPFWVMKGQPWKAQVVMVGGTLVFLIAIGYVATLI